jgi:MFS family permease
VGSRLSPLAAPAFRYFFLGQVVNRAGSSMAGLALAFAVLDISDSASALGWVLAASSVPSVVFMLFGGAIADRLPEKVPEEMLSRIMAIDGFFSFVATPIGQVAVGPLAVAFGVGGVELGCFALALLVGAVAATRRTITDVRLTGAQPEPAP